MTHSEFSCFQCHEHVLEGDEVFAEVFIRVALTSRFRSIPNWRLQQQEHTFCSVGCVSRFLDSGGLC